MKANKVPINAIIFQSKTNYSSRIMQATENVVFTLHEIFNKSSHISFNETYDLILDRGLAWSIQYAEDEEDLGFYFDRDKINCSIAWNNTDLDINGNTHVLYMLVIKQEVGHQMFPPRYVTRHCAVVI